MKKGIELSMNFLVIIVLSLVIFGFSVNFILNIYGKAKDIQTKTFEDLDKQIGYMRCGTEQVCIGDKTKAIRRGDLGVFGIRILNVYDFRTQFKLFVVPSQINRETDTNYDNEQHKIYLLPKDAQPTSDITGSGPDCGTLEARCEPIDPDKSHDFSLGVEVNKATKSGTYVFDVYVKAEKTDINGEVVWEPYGETTKYKINVVVP